LQGFRGVGRWPRSAIRADMRRCSDLGTSAQKCPKREGPVRFPPGAEIGRRPVLSGSRRLGSLNRLYGVVSPTRPHRFSRRRRPRGGAEHPGSDRPRRHSSITTCRSSTCGGSSTPLGVKSGHRAVVRRRSGRKPPRTVSRASAAGHRR
jgi:hypothetical protein